MENKSKPLRTRGRKSSLETAQYTVMLEYEPAEWAKEQPGGLSEMLRRYLRNEYEKAKMVK